MRAVKRTLWPLTWDNSAGSQHCDEGSRSCTRWCFIYLDICEPHGVKMISNAVSSLQTVPPSCYNLSSRRELGLSLLTVKATMNVCWFSKWSIHPKMPQENQQKRRAWAPNNPFSAWTDQHRLWRLCTTLKTWTDVIRVYLGWEG